MQGRIVMEVRRRDGEIWTLYENGRDVESARSPSDLCIVMAGRVSASIANIGYAGGDCVASVVSDTESLIEYTLPDTRGLLGTVGDYEYFTFRAGGDIYRAGVFNPLDVDGFRMGARFESTPAAWSRLLSLLGDSFKAVSYGRT
jgi:hypothetical protein